MSDASWAKLWKYKTPIVTPKNRNGIESYPYVAYVNILVRCNLSTYLVMLLWYIPSWFHCRTALSFAGEIPVFDAYKANFFVGFPMVCLQLRIFRPVNSPDSSNGFKSGVDLKSHLSFNTRRHICIYIYYIYDYILYILYIFIFIIIYIIYITYILCFFWTMFTSPNNSEVFRIPGSHGHLSALGRNPTCWSWRCQAVRGGGKPLGGWWNQQGKWVFLWSYV